MDKGLYYLAVPYHGSEEQQAYRHELSLKAAAEFLRQELHVFSPIIYVNQIIEKLNLPSLEKRRTIVMPYLLDFLRVSKGLILIKEEGWQNSWGIQQELNFCQENKISVYTMNPDQIYENLTEILSYPLGQNQINQLLEAV
ncbi:MAG: DUF1937 family protein [Alphaproteobacteria bacterium]|nr:DUF1937 family protein [Alphaproteobacteria bacterium]